MTISKAMRCGAAVAMGGGTFLWAQPALADPVATIERAEAAMLDGRRDDSLRLAEQAADPCLAPGPNPRACIYVLDTAGTAAKPAQRAVLR